MTKVPDSLPEDFGTDVHIDPDAPFANAHLSEKDKAKAAYIADAKGTPWEEFAKAVVTSCDANTKSKLAAMLEVQPSHPTIACAALSHFIFDIERGLIRFGSEDQQEKVVDQARQALGIFAYLCDPKTLP